MHVCIIFSADCAYLAAWFGNHCNDDGHNWLFLCSWLFQASQEVPEWLEGAADSATGSAYGRGGGGGFGGQDVREVSVYHSGVLLLLPISDFVVRVLSTCIFRQYWLRRFSSSLRALKFRPI